MKLLPKFSKRDDSSEIYSNLIRQEAKIGGQLFGAVAPGHYREFFCLDEHTWVWHEEWIDANGQRQVATTRYELRHDGILKVQNNQPYQWVGYDEARNLFRAVELYVQRIVPLYGSSVAV